MKLIICESCGKHRIEDKENCVHCTGSRTIATPNRVAIALLMGFAFSACEEDDDTAVQPMYGVAMIDFDEDGFDSEEDCDDEDPDVNPDAEEIVGDGVDSNCDGEDDE